VYEFALAFEFELAAGGIGKPGLDMSISFFGDEYLARRGGSL
jgi:hypothetical protein